MNSLTGYDPHAGVVALRSCAYSVSGLIQAQDLFLLAWTDAPPTPDWGSATFLPNVLAIMPPSGDHAGAPPSEVSPAS